MPSPQRPRPHTPPTPEPLELVDPRWILKALLASFAVAAACAYIVLCFVFLSRQWQIVLHPSRSVAVTPASLNLPFEPVRFGSTAAEPETAKSGSESQPGLAGWWVPGDIPGEPTALLLHGGDGSLSDTLPDIQALHNARVNVLAFDPRGFGQSAGDHPTERSMEADSNAAYAWLTAAHGVKPAQLVVFGEGLGASLAVRLCDEHPDIGALILESGDGDTGSRARTDPRATLVPFGWLYHQRFPLADPLHTLRTPKLILSYTRGNPPLDAQRAADPKMTFEIPSRGDTPALHEALRRFLGVYLFQPPNLLLPDR